MRIVGISRHSALRYDLSARHPLADCYDYRTPSEMDISTLSSIIMSDNDEICPIVPAPRMATGVVVTFSLDDHSVFDCADWGANQEIKVEAVARIGKFEVRWGSTTPHFITGEKGQSKTYPHWYFSSITSTFVLAEFYFLTSKKKSQLLLGQGQGW